MLAAKVPAAAAPALSQPAGSVQFASNVAQNSFKNTVALNQAAPVLANFQVQQNGNAIRVVDADGSVYDGELQPESVATQNIPVQPALPAQNEQQKTIATRDELQAVQPYFFRVTGMNQTLKQKVVFAGNLLAMANVTTNFQQSSPDRAGLGVNAQSEISNQWPWSNSRIAGTAILAGTNHIEINAVPLSP
jgi:hypothetical protein